MGIDQLSLGELQSRGQNIGNIDQIDPRFVDPANFDFSLQASSPLIDAGTKPVTYGEVEQRYGVSISLDNDLDYRPANGADWDVGAFEF